MGRSLAVWGSSRDVCEGYWRGLGNSWGGLGASWGGLGKVWGGLVEVLRRLGDVSEQLGELWVRFWRTLGSFLRYAGALGA